MSQKVSQKIATHLFIMIGLGTAMRRMEILAIKLKDIDLEKRIIHIPHAKAGARQQPITTQLAEFLKHYIDNAQFNQEWLFPAEHSASKHTMNIEKPFRRVVKAAGLDPRAIGLNFEQFRYF